MNLCAIPFAKERQRKIPTLNLMKFIILDTGQKPAFALKSLSNFNLILTKHFVSYRFQFFSTSSSVSEFFFFIFIYFVQIPRSEQIKDKIFILWFSDNR